MASHTEMKRLAEDAAGVRSLAATLLDTQGCDWTDWELDFLEHMSRRDGNEPLSMRQREVLSDLRDRAERVREWRGIPVTRLVGQCWQARLDLDEDDEEFITRLAAAGSDTIRKGQIGRLTRIAATLGVIELHMRGARNSTPEPTRNQDAA